MSNRQIPDGQRRLAILYRYLGTVKEDEFDLKAWDCGTTACAIGHGIRCPELQAEGLSFSSRWGFIMPEFNGLIHWTAVNSFFELKPKEAERLFLRDSYPTPDPSASYLEWPAVPISNVRARIQEHLAMAGVHV